MGQACVIALKNVLLIILDVCEGWGSGSEIFFGCKTLKILEIVLHKIHTASAADAWVAPWPEWHTYGAGAASAG